MIFIALLLAGVLVAFSVFAAFGLPWLVMGNRAFEEFSERRDQQVIAGTLAAAAFALACLPLINSALISAGPHMQVFAETVLGVPARIWG